MTTRACALCYTRINQESPAYFLNHEDNVACGRTHVFDRVCIAEIQRTQSCPCCKSHRFNARLLPPPLEDQGFYEKYRTRHMEIMALSPPLMMGLQKISSAFFGYIPVNGLGRLIGQSTAAAFGGYVSLITLFGAILQEPFGWSSRDGLVNGVSMLSGMAVTHYTMGFDDWGTQVGAALMLTSGLASVVFARLKRSSSI